MGITTRGVTGIEALREKKNFVYLYTTLSYKEIPYNILD